MATAIVDLFELLEGIPAGAWVAISERQHSVLAYGADAQSVLSEAQAKGNTVHLSIFIAIWKSIDGSGLCLLRRRGKLLILRLTPRGFRRRRLDTTRSWRISSSAKECRAFLRRGGNGAERSQFAADNANSV